MEISNNVFYAAIVGFLLLNFHALFSEAQQEYTNNKQSDCGNPTNATLGNACNSVSSCLSYLTFRSISPYTTPATIASLLNSTAAAISTANDLSGDADEAIPVTTNLIVPVNCSCSGSGLYYQYNSSYVLKTNDTYFSMANSTFQGLTTCQALIAQNTYGERNLTSGLNVSVPLRCACPTSNQTQAGFKYLITYMISQGESVGSIAQQFGVDVQSVLDANKLSGNNIFFFTPLMVPLKQEPNKTQLVITTTTPPPPPPPPSAVPSGDGDSDSSTKWVIVGVVVGAGLVVILGIFLFFYCRRRRQSQLPEAKKVSVSEIDTGKNLFDSSTNESWSVSLDGLRDAVASLTVYKFEELQKATNFFSEKNRIKGSVYRASFKGDDAAIKELQGDVSGEINILVQINHTNIIRLSGFCVSKGNTYLVYEFAQNGSLDNWLHSTKHENSITLNWKQRVQIAYDVADALNYLHNYTNPVHIHKNLNSGNVLLDSNFRAKVSNFGLARTVNDEEEGGFQLTRHVIGTRGYMPPEYTENGVISPKMDVFAFGVVILELLSGREAIAGEVMLAASISDVLEGKDGEREKIRVFMDPILDSEYPLVLAHSLAQLAKRCVSSDYNSRPAMSEVLTTLSKIQSTTLDWDPSEES
ncbi:hypothetical protein L6164_029111 [Bauhinia variegata]|uniref:Uncharacterized protein n=1 Tax=Bauhinia variegata TaxID=167791 RepID=A0ACB9L7S2_BAUVA|nr:hypothetical protein L6164_029111 [Bauhinia variegata]